MLYELFEKRINAEANPIFDSKNKVPYRKKIMEINTAFKNALFEANGIENNSKREDCYRIAWEYGHSSGYSEIEIYFQELVELIK